jgi:hypothetical protein
VLYNGGLELCRSNNSHGFYNHNVILFFVFLKSIFLFFTN